MIDLKLLQNNFTEISAKLLRKGIKIEILEDLEDKFNTLKKAKNTYEDLKSQLNYLSKQYGILRKNNENITELSSNIDNIKSLLDEALEYQRDSQAYLDDIAMTIPNIPDDTVPDGFDENNNIEISKILEPNKFNFKPKEHWELAENNGWIDFEKGVNLATSRFSVSFGMGARLERALINFMLDFNRECGFEEVSVPAIVNRKALEGTGQLPKFEEDLYKIDGQEMFLIPTAEVPVTNLYQDEVLKLDTLPIKMTAYTSCFRKEAGAAGRDTRGMIRQHQFHKVELVAITTPEQSEEIFNTMVNCASDILTALKLPHRLVNLCTGDLGFSAAHTTDIEVWLPGQNQYREISSISNTREFQARRAKIRYKNEDKKNVFVNTLNGSSLAVGRTLVAIMENNQNKDGTINIPDVLKPYLGIKK